MKKLTILALIGITIFAFGCSKGTRRIGEGPRPERVTEEMTAEEHRIALRENSPEPIEPSVAKKIQDIEMIEMDSEGQFSTPKKEKEVIITEYGEFESENALVTPPPKTKSSEPIVIPSPDTEEGRKTNGFRVQIAASSSEAGANKIANEARGTIGNQKVYVQYISPYWKVQVGNCKTRAEAENLRERLRSLGYHDAWIVKAEIIVE